MELSDAQEMNRESYATNAEPMRVSRARDSGTGTNNALKRITSVYGASSYEEMCESALNVELELKRMEVVKLCTAGDAILLSAGAA